MLNNISDIRINVIEKIIVFFINWTELGYWEE